MAYSATLTLRRQVRYSPPDGREVIWLTGANRPIALPFTGLIQELCRLCKQRGPPSTDNCIFCYHQVSHRNVSITK